MMFWGLMSWSNVKASGRDRALHSDHFVINANFFPSSCFCCASHVFLVLSFLFLEGQLQTTCCRRY